MSVSLKSFLASAKQALASSSRPLTLVVGNESADLDSLCCATLYAYFQTAATPKVPHIPLANLVRADLALRPELTTVLSHADLSMSDLITLDDLPSSLTPDETAWVLVDHNALTGRLTPFQSRVTGCIDHHVDEGKLPPGIAPRILEICGSCSSLVVERYREIWDSLRPDTVRDAGLARLAMAPLVIDTGNLAVVDKTTPRDVRVAKVLEAKLGNGFVRKSYYDEISKMKEDLSQMSLRDVLRKDYKEWHDGGISLGTCASPRGLDYLVNKAGKPDVFVKAVGDWAAEKKVDLLAVMTTIMAEDKFNRELVLWGISEVGIAVVKKFKSDFRDNIGLDTWNGGVLDGNETGYRRAWTQRNVTAGRKQIGPILREIMTKTNRI
ncbi:putative exopolyphosphatase [Ceratocystis platani]|uniref:Putative exopolyphosphatase n=1 Tax=Ceratocystis fimbriata f. sp. platani TaxID=88771 RepID=A0A0F8BVL9_CERFI|nr:putative exopolyphosphatase [Ceratocystis platani]